MALARIQDLLGERQFNDRLVVEDRTICDTAAVDVYLSAFSGGTSTLWLSSVSYGDVSHYSPINPGVYAVSMRPHGAAASTPAVLTWTVNIAAGSAYTAAAVGTNNRSTTITNSTVQM